LLAVTVVLGACSAQRIVLDGNYPTPLTSKLPLTIGVYYTDNVKEFTYTELNENNGKEQYIIESGNSQVEMFNTLLPAMFTDVVVLDNLDDIPARYPQLDAVFVPVIDDFQLGLPAKTRLASYEIWIKYNMRLSDVNGNQIADWVMTAYGKSPEETFQSVDAGVNDAANVALRDLAASFTLGFSNIPEVNEWLRSENALGD
jgi:hypothetical protein